MNLQQKLNICSTCTNRKLDINTGIVCNLTNEKPTFEPTCSDYNKDENTRETILAAKYIDLEILKTEQHFSIGILFATIAGGVFSFLWAIITIATQYQISIMAIAIGAGVGFTMRYFGKGIDIKFGIAGAIIAFLSCFLGNILSILGMVATQQQMNIFEVLIRINLLEIVKHLFNTITLFQILFYVLAIVQGFKFSFRNMEREKY